jgi:hypothetical protein
MLIVIADDSQQISGFIDASQNATDVPFKMECVKTLAEGANRFRPPETKAIFISQSLVDRQNRETLDNFLLSAVRVPVLVLASKNESESEIAVLRLAGICLSGDPLYRHSVIPIIRQLLEPNFEDKIGFAREVRIRIERRFVTDTLGNLDDLAGSHVYLAFRDEPGGFTGANRGEHMSTLNTQYRPPRLTAYSCAESSLSPARDDDADYTMVDDTDTRMLELGLTPPIHKVCDNCWKPAAMGPFGWTVRSKAALCCFCGAFTTCGKQAAYWALDVICGNKH